MNRKQKINCAKAGVIAYGVSSAIAYLKHGGIELINQPGLWAIKIHKTLGVIDVFRMHGHLANMHVFGDDWLFFTVGMFSGVAAAGAMWAIEYYQGEEKAKPKVEKTNKGYKVKLKRDLLPENFKLK